MTLTDWPFPAPSPLDRRDLSELPFNGTPDPERNDTLLFPVHRRYDAIHAGSKHADSASVL